MRGPVAAGARRPVGPSRGGMGGYGKGPANGVCGRKSRGSGLH